METYRKAIILGYGRSGKAAESLLQLENVEVRVLDEESNSGTDVAHCVAEFDADVCIVSPGFSLTHPWMTTIQRGGIPLLSELELGWSRHQGKTIALTGSNGKSTAVKWIYDALVKAGESAVIGGNYGTPASEAVVHSPHAKWLVLEVSSFQLETVSRFQPDIAVLLNLLPNHLDRHETMDVYRRMKARIFGCPGTTGNMCVVPEEMIDLLKEDAAGDHQWTSFGGEEGADYQYSAGAVLHHRSVAVSLEGTMFDNPVLGSCTGAAVTAVAGVCDIDFTEVAAAAKSFDPLPHRLELVGIHDSVSYINDSKATNLAAMSAALQANGKRIRLIAGGLLKESDLTFIKEILAERVRSIYLVGQASHSMYMAWNEVCPCVECETIEHAFGEAVSAAAEGDTVLLSPGCASFDQFRSFEERGERFISLFQDMVC